jgi:presenilin-like A22 family membrane protease
MEHRTRMVLASGAIVGIFLLVQLGALALVEPFQEEGHQVVEDTSDPSISIVYLLAILVMTALMLAAIKYGGASLLRLLIIFAGAYISFFVLQILVPSGVNPTVGGTTVDVLAGAGALAIGLALYFYPEWYVIDAAGILMGIGAAGLFGVNFGILPAVVLLTVLAVYDAVSVYGTEHMLTLAEGVMEMRVPVVLVVPLSLSYSFLDSDPPESLQEDDEEDSGEDDDTDSEEGKETSDTGEETSDTGEGDDKPALTAERLAGLSPAELEQLEPERLADLDEETLEELDEETREHLQEAMPRRDAMFIGLGDAVIPTVLVASAALFVDTGPTLSLPAISATLPAVTAMVGTLLGLVVLLWLVAKGRAHAGLPLLNGGAIGGYLVGALASGLSLVEALGLSGVL